MVMGAPGRVRRQLTDDELAELPQFWKNYVELKKHYEN
jgi:carbonic anhydrase/acetyltransferase-like protein (isoleucine patch superfamily)